MKNKTATESTFTYTLGGRAPSQAKRYLDFLTDLASFFTIDLSNYGYANRNFTSCSWVRDQLYWNAKSYQEKICVILLDQPNVKNEYQLTEQQAYQKKLCSCLNLADDIIIIETVVYIYKKLIIAPLQDLQSQLSAVQLSIQNASGKEQATLIKLGQSLTNLANPHLNSIQYALEYAQEDLRDAAKHCDELRKIAIPGKHTRDEVWEALAASADKEREHSKIGKLLSQLEHQHKSITDLVNTIGKAKSEFAPVINNFLAYLTEIKSVNINTDDQERNV